MIINLDPEFTPLGDGSKLETFYFPGGEAHVKLKNTCVGNVMFTTRLNSGDDIMQLLMATDAARRNGTSDIRVFIPYLPYARQDRVMVQGEPLSLRVMANLLNSQNYAEVYTYDVHSDVAPALINNLYVHTNHALVKTMLLDNVVFSSQEQRYVLVAPDAGALKKMFSLAKAISYKWDIAVGEKVRDVSTGEIKRTRIHYDDSVKDRDFIIVDDICDGGATFIALAQELKERDAASVSLIVSHGIFSKGLKPIIDGGIDHIYTTDSIRTVGGDWAMHNDKYLHKLTQYKLFEGLR